MQERAGRKAWRGRLHSRHAGQADMLTMEGFVCVAACDAGAPHVLPASRCPATRAPRMLCFDTLPAIPHLQLRRECEAFDWRGAAAHSLAGEVLRYDDLGTCSACGKRPG